MIKNHKKVLIFLLILITFVIPFDVYSSPNIPSVIPGASAINLLGYLGIDISSLLNPVSGVVGVPIAWLIFTGLGWFFSFCAFILDYSITLSVLEFKKNISGMLGIDVVWDLIRNLINMSFIFILIYKGIQNIIFGEEDVKKIITKIVTTAILINFSLFFTRVIIDASNVITYYLYDNIIGEGNSFSAVIQSGLQLGTFWKADSNLANFITDGNKVLIMYIIGSIFLLIASIVVFSIAMLFIMRYIALIVLMAISPIGVAKGLIPQLDKYSDRYWKTLKNQAIWPPIYMLLTWIMLILINSPGFITGYSKEVTFAKFFENPSESSIVIVVNYIVIISMLIFSLKTSKDVATEGEQFLSDGFSKLTAYGGGIGIGSLAWLGRNSLGKGGQMLMNNKKIQESAAKGNFLSRQMIKYGSKASESMFDFRNTKLAGSLNKHTGVDLGKGGDFLWLKNRGAGGLAGVQKRKIEKGTLFSEGTEDSEKLAKILGPNEEEIKKAKEELENRKSEFEKLKKEQEEIIRDREKDNIERLKADAEADAVRQNLGKLDIKIQRKKVADLEKQISDITRDLDEIPKKIKDDSEEISAIRNKINSTSTEIENEKNKIRSSGGGDIQIGQSLIISQKTARMTELQDQLEEIENRKKKREKRNADIQIYRDDPQKIIEREEELDKEKKELQKKEEGRRKIIEGSDYQKLTKQIEAEIQSYLSKEEADLISRTGGQNEKKEGGNVIQRGIGNYSTEYLENMADRIESSVFKKDAKKARQLRDLAKKIKK